LSCGELKNKQEKSHLYTQYPLAKEAQKHPKFKQPITNIPRNEAKLPK